MKKHLLIALFVMCSVIANAQLLHEKKHYTRGDTLRGSLRKERNFDVRKYHLNIRVIPDKRFITGYTGIEFIPQEDLKTIQIDLFENMNVDSVVYRSNKLPYTREFNAVFIDFPAELKKNVRDTINFYYSGNPQVAKRAPWDGGFVFSRDTNGNDWIATACQGLGASAWWPNKDHQTDEPDEGMTISVAVPHKLMNVSNGRFIGSKNLGDGYTRWDWKVENPINNYDVAVNIGDYVHFGENYKGLDLDYYVLRDNLDKAEKQFEQVKTMMDCFQDKFGDYPFIEDGYKLVETPHLGMEHQSAIAYGNKYKMGYLGSDLSGSGVGLRVDFIVIHESGHEWFGNSLTAKDLADMWIHEGFTTYADDVYLECQYGYEDAMKYMVGLRNSISNDIPIIGDYGVNNEGSGDMYYKGANMINTLRHIVNNDDKWWKMIKKFALTFRHKTLTTDDVVNFFEKESDLILKPVFDQYLRYTSIPTLVLEQTGKDVTYYWKTNVENFSMPVEINAGEKTKQLNATNSAKKLKNSKVANIMVNTTKFYVNVEKDTKVSTSDQ